MIHGSETREARFILCTYHVHVYVMYIVQYLDLRLT